MISSDKPLYPSSLTLPSVLIVESDSCSNPFVAAAFVEHGWHAHRAASGHQALDLAFSLSPTLVVLYLTLPDMHGFELLRRLRQNGETPVIVIGESHDAAVAIATFELGGNDYVSQPFSVQELIRRAERLAHGSGASSVITDRNVIIDLARRLLYIDHQPVSLPPMTFDVLVVLVRNKGRVVSEAELLRVITKSTAKLRTRRVSYHITLLRHVLQKNGIVDAIRTVRARGYEWIGS